MRDTYRARDCRVGVTAVKKSSMVFDFNVNTVFYEERTEKSRSTVRGSRYCLRMTNVSGAGANHKPFTINLGITISSFTHPMGYIHRPRQSIVRFHTPHIHITPLITSCLRRTQRYGVELVDSHNTAMTANIAITAMRGFRFV